jgi:hypothetical protein
LSCYNDGWYIITGTAIGLEFGMLRYSRLKRNIVDEGFHRAMFMFYAMITKIMPLPSEVLTWLTVFIEAISNICKFFFRSPYESRYIIEE